MALPARAVFAHDGWMPARDVFQFLGVALEVVQFFERRAWAPAADSRTIRPVLAPVWLPAPPWRLREQERSEVVQRPYPGMLLRLAVLLVVVPTGAASQEHHVVTAVVTDASTYRAAGGLTPEDVELVQGGEAYPAQSVRPLSGPLDVMVVVDRDPPAMALMRSALISGARLAEHEFAPEDRAGLVVFGRSVQVKVLLNGGGRAALRALDSATRSQSLSNPTRHVLYDAVLAAIERLPERSAGRSSHVLVFALLPDSGSKAAPVQVVAEARKRRVAIDGIVFSALHLSFETRLRLALSPSATERDLRRICVPTGGEASIVEPSGYVFRQAIARMHSRLEIAGVTRGAGPATLRLTPRGAIRHPDVVLRVLADEVMPLPAGPKEQ